MSQKQKSILSFFKQADSKKETNATNSSLKKDKDDSKDSIVKKNLKKEEKDDSKDSSVKMNLKKEDKDDSEDTSVKKNLKKEDIGYSKDSSVKKKSKKLDSDHSKNLSPSSQDLKMSKQLTNGSGKKKMDKTKEIEKCRNKDSIDESPVKQTKKRKRAKILDSDDESQNADELPSKKHEADKNEVSNDNLSNGCPDTETKRSVMSDTESENSKLNGALPGDDVQDDEPMEEDQSGDNDSETSEMVDMNDTDTIVNGSSSDVQAENIIEFIPKRKTARKQMRGGQQKKVLFKKKSDDTSKTPTANEEKNEIKTNGDLKSKELNSKCSDKDINKDDNNSDSSSKEEDSDNNSELNSKEEENDNNSDSSIKEEENDNSDLRIKKEPKENISEENETKDVKKEIQSPEKKEYQASDIKEEVCSDTESNKEDDKKKKKDTKSKKKQAIHPFFAKSKQEEVSSTEGDPKKTAAKAPSSTGVVYDPSKSHYHPIEDACWKQNEKVPYLALAKTLELIESITKRLKIVEILANYFRSVIVLTPEDLLQSVYLCLNRLAPEYEGIELGIGELLLMKALAQATGRTTGQIKAEVAVKGDLGLVAESSRGNQRLMFAPPKLTVASVFSKFKEIAKMSGNTAMAKKTDKIQALFVACRECEAKYIIRSLSGKLRIGLAEQSVLAALARAAVLTPPNQSYPPEIIDKSSKVGAESFKEHLNSQTLILKTTYCECPNYDLVIPVLLKEGIAGLPVHCQLTAGFPLKPMLAHPTNGIDEVLNRFDKNEFTCEFKYDGERAQIHMTDKGEIKIYSRNQEDNTSKYPDVISRISKAVKETTKSFILDTEAVAWDCETKQILPFQVLSTRKKKDAVEADIVVQVCIMAFDLIYLNGESLVKKPLKERRDLLHSSFTEVDNEFMFVTYRDGNSAETMQEFLDESLKGNCEGLMVKALIMDASYEIAKRSHNWLKLKKDYLSGIGDTLDLVVIGGYHGKGKRAGTYGGFLLACYDDENEEFQTICKLGTGFSDTDLENHTKFFKDHVIELPKSYYRYDTSLEPDVWFDAVQIWEIKCADLSISPIHKAAIGIVDPEKGISLRFPRFLRIRDDKSKPEDATISSRIADMYEKQDQVQNAKKTTTQTEEDYY